MERWTNILYSFLHKTHNPSIYFWMSTVFTVGIRKFSLLPYRKLEQTTHMTNIFTCNAKQLKARKNKDFWCDNGLYLLQINYHLKVYLRSNSTYRKYQRFLSKFCFSTLKFDRWAPSVALAKRRIEHTK